MNDYLIKIFQEDEIIKRIKEKLPKLFQLAELESQRAGRIGMEVGSLRERIIVSSLIYKFGGKNVNTEIPITETEIDVKLFETPISIKTKTGSGFSGVKLIWTVDAQNAKEFREKYSPLCDMIFVQIMWEDTGSIFYFPVEVQHEVFESLNRVKYIKLPSLGTNPRGVEITSEALKALVNHTGSYKIDIEWKREEIKFNAFKRWVDLWAQN